MLFKSSSLVKGSEDMVDFNKIKYERINFEKTKSTLEILIKRLQEANNFNEYIKIVKKINFYKENFKNLY